MNKVVHLLPMGRVIEELMEWYKNGKVNGMVSVVKLNDGGYALFLSDELSCIEKLGLIEAAKIDIIGKALEVIE